MINSLEQLYILLNPVFDTKIRIAKYYGYTIDKKDIWKYLSIYKWRIANDLQLSEIVNDIVCLDINKMLKVMEDSKNEKR